MAIWTGDDYQIDKVSSNTNPSDSTKISYLVEIQRLPSEKYPDETVVSIHFGVIPTADTADSWFASSRFNYYQCNTELASIDSDTSPRGDP